ncbi:ethanolamine utilization protein eutT [Hyaloscypha hepaticicola]|uniref:Ethanolamine utilization protein eutT n=1 Tax=Hyaloscypha hepaticicola TaxID=2082293 RepID=A0A2J6PN40_9HELO|nr:ethanolamine utilization protein eutT [Hyaloscypha hepaticicola]
MATKTQELLTLEGAKIAIAAAEKKAKEMGLGMNIAVVDASTHLLHFSRMEGAKITSISIAIDKAFTAAGHRVGTHMYKDAVWPGGAAYGLGNTNGGRFTTFGGGLPIMNAKGEVLGGIGASTGTPAQDQQVVQAGVDALQEVLKGRVRAKL